MQDKKQKNIVVEKLRVVFSELPLPAFLIILAINALVIYYVPK